jgi:4-diphosphocytidyl-2-C-methyl-D-erythritol kinase
VRLRALAPGKVNLGLFLGPVRDDGRHELVTLYDSVSLADSLTLEVREDSSRADEVVCPGVEGPNLAADALAGLRDLGWDAPPVLIEISKRIPVAGGMAGGSADAAATLRLAAALAPGRPEEVAQLAARLGSDVPGQLVPGLSLGTGAGDLVERMPAGPPRAYAIVPLSVALSTADVYREADRLGVGRSFGELADLASAVRLALAGGGPLPAELAVNDLGSAAVSLCPPIAPALAAVAASGADQAFVSGSGPTVAGLFWGADAPDRAAAAGEALSARFPGATAAVPVGAEVAMPRIA